MHTSRYGWGIGLLGLITGVILYVLAQMRLCTPAAPVVDSTDVRILNLWHEELAAHLQTGIQNGTVLVPDTHVLHLDRLDLNTATAQNLRHIKGIGKVRSARIIRYRNALGGFAHIDQLNEINGLPTDVIERLKRLYAIADSLHCCQRLAINALTASALFSHPYMRQDSLAYALVKARYQGGLYFSFQDLCERLPQHAAVLKRLKPYLDFDAAKKK